MLHSKLLFIQLQSWFLNNLLLWLLSKSNNILILKDFKYFVRLIFVNIISYAFSILFWVSLLYSIPNIFYYELLFLVIDFKR